MKQLKHSNLSVRHSKTLPKPPTKHLIPISPLQLFLFILRGLYFEDELFSLSFPLFYSITTIHILWDCLSSLSRFNIISLDYQFKDKRIGVDRRETQFKVKRLAERIQSHIPFPPTDPSNLIKANFTYQFSIF